MMMNIQKKLDDSVSFQTFVLQSVFHSLLLNKDILEEMVSPTISLHPFLVQSSYEKIVYSLHQ